jgi:integrase
MRVDFVVYPRKRVIRGSTKKAKVWYVAFGWDEELQRYTYFRSTGKRSRREAEELAKTIIDTLGASHPGESFAEKLEAFWAIDSDYTRRKQKDKKPLSVAYLKDNAFLVKKYALPWFRLAKLDIRPINYIKPVHLEKFLDWLQNPDAADSPHLSDRRANAARQAVAVPFGEWTRLGLIKDNPAAKVRKVSEIPPVRDIMTPEEARKILQYLFHGDLRFYALNLLSAISGLRLGECQGLKIDRISDGWIDVCAGWAPEEGLKNTTKTRKNRRVPIHPDLIKLLRELYSHNPYRNGFVFYSTEHRNQPLSRKAADLVFADAACKSLKISDETRQARKLTFHAWRHYYDSQLSDILEGSERRGLTGHSNDRMDRVYLHITDKQVEAAIELSTEIMKDLPNGLTHESNQNYA